MATLVKYQEVNRIKKIIVDTPKKKLVEQKVKVIRINGKCHQIISILDLEDDMERYIANIG